MCMIYVASFLPSLVGIFGVGHLLNGQPRRGGLYFVAGLAWLALGILTGLATGFSILCFIPLHLLLAHLCAMNATQRP